MFGTSAGSVFAVSNSPIWGVAPTSERKLKSKEFSAWSATEMQRNRTKNQCKYIYNEIDGHSVGHMLVILYKNK